MRSVHESLNSSGLWAPRTSLPRERINYSDSAVFGPFIARTLKAMAQVVRFNPQAIPSIATGDLGSRNPDSPKKQTGSTVPWILVSRVVRKIPVNSFSLAIDHVGVTQNPLVCKLAANDPSDNDLLVTPL